MLIQLLIFLLWAAGSYLVFLFLPPWCIVVYAVATLVGALIWAATRKPKSLNDQAK